MARSQPLLTPEPTAIVRQPVSICHVQLRDLVICPGERGVVNYVQEQCIMERDITDPAAAQTPLVTLNYIPNTIASLNIPDSDERLLAAGGQDAELHLSIHSRRPAAPVFEPEEPDAARASRRLWQYDGVLSGSINNSVLLTSLSLTRSNESSAEPRVAVSNNDCTVKFYDVNVRGAKGVDGPPKRISDAGTLRLDVPVNHSSISPDGRTLLSVGDSPQVYLHAMTGGARITFTPLAQLTLPPLEPRAGITGAGAMPASFCTAFSPSGAKFAVASQEGMVAVWDVRSRKPMRVFYTDRSRVPPGRAGRAPTGASSGWLYEDVWDWTMPGHKAPGWGVRNVKFGAGIGGREVMTFTEHTSLLHVVDATTFEQEEIIRVPAIAAAAAAAAADTTPPASASPSPVPPTPPTPPAQWSPPRAHHHAHAHLHTHLHHYVPPPPPPPPVPPPHALAAQRVVHEYERRRARRLRGTPPTATTADADAEADWECARQRRAVPAAKDADAGALATPAHLDLAGTCFDARGAWVYVASTAGIVEWGVRGGEKWWWAEAAWA
ncbi:hypothetical protein BC834DRAFT_973451 [Gloeopeniophorella convolvens]|nr:hypothetical protein BC834DRAFT_973451 [Gloeopeniophorella convolvens]